MQRRHIRGKRLETDQAMKMDAEQGTRRAVAVTRTLEPLSLKKAVSTR